MDTHTDEIAAHTRTVGREDSATSAPHISLGAVAHGGHGYPYLGISFGSRPCDKSCRTGFAAPYGYMFLLGRRTCHNALRNAVPPFGTSPHNGTVTTYGRSRDSQRSVYGISAYYRRNSRDVPRRRIPHNGIHPDMGSGVVIPLLSADGRNRRVSLPRSHIPHNRAVGRLGRGNNHIGPSGCLESRHVYRKGKSSDWFALYLWQL